MKCYILIHNGDAELQRALDVLVKTGIEAIALGWGSDPVPRSRSQVQVDADNFESAQSHLLVVGIDYVPLPFKKSLVACNG
jgi:hypothetical protein